MDDDNYVNVRTLVKFLSQYAHTQDMYLGKPSLDRPIEATERLGDNKMVCATCRNLSAQYSRTHMGCICQLMLDVNKVFYVSL